MVLVSDFTLVVRPTPKVREVKLKHMSLVFVALDVDVIVSIDCQDVVNRRVIPPPAPLRSSTILNHIVALAPQEPVLIVTVESVREVTELLKLLPAVEACVNKASVLFNCI